MNFNKIELPHRKKLINIMFDELQTCQQKRQKGKEEHSFHKYIEDHVFIPRNKVKNMRIIKINDTIYTNFNTLKADHIKKMFVDGSRLHQLTHNRQIYTQNQAKRSINPQFQSQMFLQNKKIHSKRLSFYEQSMSQSIQNDRQSKQIEQNNREVLVLPIKQKSLQNSTTASSNRNIRISHRYKKPDKKNETIFKPKQISLELKKQLFQLYSNPPCSPQNISAKAYIIYQHKGGKRQDKFINKYLHAAFSSKINLEIASLTKVMTCILALEICDKFKVQISLATVKIGPYQTKIEGTSAELEIDEEYTIEQLLYGMMLPSGNDASLALSSFCGQLLQNKMQSQSQQLNKKYFTRKFILQMNRKCNQLGMKRTIFTNSHGLMNILNKSCASDLTILINYALYNKKFRTIISCHQYEAIISKLPNESILKTRSIRWENTHKLILTKPQIYLGIKTGTTQAAGPCLASLVSTGGRQFIIIVLHSRSSKWRYKDTEQLREWLFSKEKL